MLDPTASTPAASLQPNNPGVHRRASLTCASRPSCSSQLLVAGVALGVLLVGTAACTSSDEPIEAGDASTDPTSAPTETTAATTANGEEPDTESTTATPADDESTTSAENPGTTPVEATTETSGTEPTATSDTTSVEDPSTSANTAPLNEVWFEGSYSAWVNLQPTTDEGGPFVYVQMDGIKVREASFVTTDGTRLPGEVRLDGVIVGSGAVYEAMVEGSNPGGSNSFQGVDVLAVAEIDGAEQLVRLVQPTFDRVD